MSFAPLCFQAKFVCGQVWGVLIPPQAHALGRTPLPQPCSRAMYELVSQVALRFCPCVFPEKKDLCLSTDCKN